MRRMCSVMTWPVGGNICILSGWVSAKELLLQCQDPHFLLNNIHFGKQWQNICCWTKYTQYPIVLFLFDMPQFCCEFKLIVSSYCKWCEINLKTWWENLVSRSAHMILLTNRLTLYSCHGNIKTFHDVSTCKTPHSCWLYRYFSFYREQHKNTLLFGTLLPVPFLKRNWSHSSPPQEQSVK